MTDKEIIQALKEMSAEYNSNFSKLVLDLINRQQAEIENYRHNNKNLTATIMKLQAEVKRLKIEKL